MQDEDAGVEAQELRVEQAPARCVRFLLRRGDGVGHEELHHPDRREREHSREREDAAHAHGAIEPGRADQRHGEHEADGGADHRHDLGAVLLAGEVGGERHGDRIDRARALQRARRDRGPDVVRGYAEEAARGEHHEAHVDRRLAAPAVGSHAEGDLQHALRQAVGAERHADQREVGPALELRRVDREHGKDEEEPEHAQPVHAREARAGAQLDAAHLFIHGETGVRKGKHAIVASFALISAEWIASASAVRARIT